MAFVKPVWLCTLSLLVCWVVVRPSSCVTIFFLGVAIILCLHQVLGNVCRDACVVYAKDYISLREMYDNHPRPGLTYVWLLSQTITTAASAKHYVAAVTSMYVLLNFETSKTISMFLVI